MADNLLDLTWRDENNQKLECTEKLRLLKENEAELSQMAEDMFEDGIAMGVSEKSMKENMKKLLLHLAASFSLFAFFSALHSAQAQEQNPPPSPPPSAAPLPALPIPDEKSAATAAQPAESPLPAPTTPTLPMRSVPDTPPTLIPAPLLYPADSWEGRSIGVIRLLDRVTSETKELEIPVGASVTFHRLTIKLYRCNQKPKGLPSNTAIRLGLSEIPLKNDNNSELPLQRQFEGWFLAAEPAANIYPSPLYNIQAVRCAGEAVSPILPPLSTPPQADTPETPKEVPPSQTATLPSVTPPPAPPANDIKSQDLPMTEPVPATVPLPFSSSPVSDEDVKTKKHKHHKHEKHAKKTDSSKNSASQETLS